MEEAGVTAIAARNDYPFIERRAHLRRNAGELEWLSAFRLKYAPPVSLIDLSRGGALLDVAAYRLLPGTTVVVEIDTLDRQVIVRSHIVRCQVSGLSPHPIFRGALAFDLAADLPLPHLCRPSAPRWERVLLRFADNRVLRGFVRDFSPGADRLEVWPRPDAPQQARVTIPASRLKAVFFLDDTNEASSADHSDGDPRRVAVRFRDEEVLVGTAHEYDLDAPGFFMSHFDAFSDRIRAFVFSPAVLDITVPIDFDSRESTASPFQQSSAH